MTVATKVADKPATTEKKAPARRAPAPKATPAPKVADRETRAQDVADSQVNAAAIRDALALARLPRLRFTQLVAARGVAPGKVWRETVTGNVDDADRAVMWAVLDEYVDEDLARAIRVREHVRGVAAHYLERASS